MYILPTAKEVLHMARRDKKGRVLRMGESVRADGKYQFKYMENGKPKFLYSWRLEWFCKCKFPKVASKNGEICISVLEKVAGCAA